MSWETMFAGAFLFSLGLYAAIALWRATHQADQSKDWIEWNWDDEDLP